MPRPSLYGYYQTRIGQRRDALAREAWAELAEKRRVRIRRSVPRLYEIAGISDLGVAELLVALGEAGILALWGPEDGEMFNADEDNAGGMSGGSEG